MDRTAAGQSLGPEVCAVITQCSIEESALLGLSESPLKALNGNQTSYPDAMFKTIRFQKTIPETGIQALIDDLNANTDAIMSLLGWNSAFGWDFDINPVLDIHHSMALGGVVQDSGYKNYPADDNGSVFDQTDFNPDGSGTWHIKTVGLNKYIAYVSWILYEGPAKMLHSYNKFIGDPSYLQPPAPITVSESLPVLSSWVTFGHTMIPVVVLDPIPFSRPYKIPVPNWQTNYLFESNQFKVK